MNLITNKEIQRIRTIEGALENYLYDDSGIRELKNVETFSISFSGLLTSKYHNESPSV